MDHSTSFPGTPSGHPQSDPTEELKIYRQLVELIEDWIWEVNAQGVYTFASPVVKKLLGYTPEEIIGKTPFDLMPEKEAERVGKIFGEIVADARPFKELVNVNLHKNGHEVVLETSGSPFFNPDGSLAGYRGVDRDITQRMRIEKALRESEQNYQHLVENAQELIWKCDADGRFTYLNPAWENTHGYTVEELLGRPFTDLQTPERAALDKEEFASHLQGGSVKNYETEHVAKDGRTINLIFNAVPLLDYNGNIIGTQGTAMDVTKLKQALREQAQTREKLFQAQKLESLGLMAGSIAHDFNNLLLVILGDLEMAKGSLPDLSPALSRIEEAEHAANKATALTQQMLLYSGRGVVRVENVDLNELVEQNRSMFRAVIKRSIDLRVQVHRGLPAIRADIAQMQQLVMNLVMNAAEAIGEKEGVIQLSTGVELCDEECLETSVLHEKAQPGQFVSLEVQDNGEGMGKDTLLHLFDPFFTTKEKGRGLGLSAVLGIIRKHEGALFVKSTQGEGSSFKVLLPVNRPASKDDAGSDLTAGSRGAFSSEGAVVVAEAVPLSVEGKRVLLVDDEDMVRNVCQRMLEQLGTEVYTAVDGVNAIEVFEQLGRQVDLVIMDLSMPRMDGVEACKLIRQMKKDVPIIMASGYYDDLASARQLSDEAVKFIQKPYTSNTIREAVSSALSGR